LRNRNNVDQLYVNSTHNLTSQILSLSPNENKMVEIDTSLRWVDSCARLHFLSLASDLLIFLLTNVFPTD
jgi:hypothetical protein